MIENESPRVRPPGHPGLNYSVLKELQPYQKALRDCHLLFGFVKTFSGKVFDRSLKERRLLGWRKNELTMTCNGDRKD